MSTQDEICIVQDEMLIALVCTCVQVKEALREGYEEDVDPPLSSLAQYIKDELSNEGYKHMMAVGETSSMNTMRPSLLCDIDDVDLATLDLLRAEDWAAKGRGKPWEVWELAARQWT